MLILHITFTPMAGMPHNLVTLINKYTKHEAYLIVKKNLAFNFQCNYVIKNKEKIIELISKTDILHFHGNRNYDKKSVSGIDLIPYWQRSKKILHYHGLPQRHNSNRFTRNCMTLVSTPEMLVDYPKARFFPNLIDEYDKKYIVKEKYNLIPKFGHHYSLHSRVKNTNKFLELKEKMPNNFHIISSMKHINCLKERVKYDYIYDHSQGYYGLISIECLAQKIRVINKLNTIVKKNLLDFFGLLPPFTNIENNLKETSLNLIKSNEHWKEFKEGREFIVKHWSGKILINRLIDIYKEL